MTMHDDVTSEHHVPDETRIVVKMSTVLMIIVSLLSGVAAATNVWVYGLVQTVERNAKIVEVNSNRLSILETTQLVQDRAMDRFFLESAADRKEIKARQELQAENLARLMSKMGVPYRR